MNPKEKTKIYKVMEETVFWLLVLPGSIVIDTLGQILLLLAKMYWYIYDKRDEFINFKP